ncbi:MAG: pirin family protein [Chlamydiae bacterium]|nr:pirin family protein [Chlamydiota bacterium]MBI3266575.1 pirin family protein [Chlamydiota bacterium]
MKTLSNLTLHCAKDRFYTQTHWLDSWHSFSFGEHHDPQNTHHGLLLVHNEDIIKASTGFPMHSHQDKEEK